MTQPAPRPDGFTSVMNQRVEKADSLDDFPTPPWATRALCEVVLPELGLRPNPLDSAWEPACGRCIMAEVLGEYFDSVYASDIHGYEFGNVGPFVSLWTELCEPAPSPCHWIITNPPFRLGLDFALRALREAETGVALLVRSNWAESSDRYERLFKPYPPLCVAQFVERVPMVKGRWDPDASTATAYAWFVWLRGSSVETRYLWIPPGQRKALTRPDDVERFAGRTA